MAADEQTLEALVRDELRGPVTELVQRLVPELVHEALNGAAKPIEHPARRSAGPTKTCNRCGQSKLASEVERHRKTCKQCRRTAARSKQPRPQDADAESEGHSPGQAG